MAGKKRFDEDDALDAALTTFWRNGFDGTSLSDLEAATGLNKSSLYNTFHSKEQLFRRCLERYGAAYSGAMAEALAAPTIEQALRGFFAELCGRAQARDTPHGCLATMAAMETVATDSAAVAEQLSAGLESMRAAIEARCRRAVDDGAFRDDLDCVRFAAAVLAMARGIAALDRTPSGRAVEPDAVEGFVAMALASARPNADARMPASEDASGD